MKSPKVSVLLPAYNAEKYIKQSIDSILNQTFTDFEFIIIDDCSTDSTWEIIKSYEKKDNRIVAVRNKQNLGIAGNLNKAISLSKGEYLARMDADDWSYPDRFQKQIDILEADKHTGIVGGFIDICDEELNVLYLRKYDITDTEIRKNLFKNSPFCHPAVMYRHEVTLDNEYNIELSPTEDYDFYFRVGNQWKFSNLKDTLLKYRTSKTQSSSLKANRQQYLTLYIRLKAIVEYGYKASTKDILSSLMQLVLIPLLPQLIKVSLFNLLRKNL
jgi:glycosyltransferase involved in cell wall biosynthesis